MGELTGLIRFCGKGGEALQAGFFLSASYVWRKESSWALGLNLTSFISINQNLVYADKLMPALRERSDRHFLLRL